MVSRQIVTVRDMLEALEELVDIHGYHVMDVQVKVPSVGNPRKIEFYPRDGVVRIQ